MFGNTVRTVFLGLRTLKTPTNVAKRTFAVSKIKNIYRNSKIFGINSIVAINSVVAI
jgi:hypothetical protein